MKTKEEVCWWSRPEQGGGAEVGALESFESFRESEFRASSSFPSAAVDCVLCVQRYVQRTVVVASVVV